MRSRRTFGRLLSRIRFQCISDDLLHQHNSVQLDQDVIAVDCGVLHVLGCARQGLKLVYEGRAGGLGHCNDVDIS